MKLFKQSSTLLMLIVLVASPVMFEGCGGRTLSPTGYYQGDKTLYEADKAIGNAYDTLNAFVSWEYENRAALAKYPDITKAADRVRADAPKYLKSATDLREAYATEPNKENKNQLQSAIAILRQALTEATSIMAKPLSQ